MATEPTNGLGYVPLMDGGNPRTITVLAKTIISGGTWVMISGVTTVGSSTASFTSSDFIAEKVSVYGRVNGVAIQDIGSNKYGTIATRGICLMKAGGVVSGGQILAMISGAQYDGVVSITGVDAGSVVEGYVGRALTGAGSESYVAVSLNL